MTGRDLILYILENNLENEPVFQNNRLLGFMTTMEAATKFEVGLATIQGWIAIGSIESIRLGSETYIPANSEDPRYGGKHGKKSNENWNHDGDCEYINALNGVGR